MTVNDIMLHTKLYVVKGRHECLHRNVPTNPFLFWLLIPAEADSGIALEAVRGTERSHPTMTHSKSAGLTEHSGAEQHSRMPRNISDSHVLEKSRSPTDKDSVYSSDSIGSLDQTELSDLDQGRTRGSSPSTDLPMSDSPVSITVHTVCWASCVTFIHYRFTSQLWVIPPLSYWLFFYSCLHCSVTEILSYFECTQYYEEHLVPSQTCVF